MTEDNINNQIQNIDEALQSIELKSSVKKSENPFKYAIIDGCSIIISPLLYISIPIIDKSNIITADRFADILSAKNEKSDKILELISLKYTLVTQVDRISDLDISGMKEILKEQAYNAMTTKINEQVLYGDKKNGLKGIFTNTAIKKETFDDDIDKTLASMWAQLKNKNSNTIWIVNAKIFTQIAASDLYNNSDNTIQVML